MRRFGPTGALAAAAAVCGLLAIAAVSANDVVEAQPPITVSCDDTGTVSYSPDPLAVRWEVWNTGANTACLSFCGADCTAQAPDRADVTTCSFVLGPYAGGTPTVWAVDAGLHGARARAAAAAVECDSAGAVLVFTEWRRRQ